MSKIKKVTNNLPYYILALLITILILILWQGFREKETPPPLEKIVPVAVKKSTSTDQDNVKIFFASNGKDIAYKIKKGDKWSVIFNGVEGKEYNFVSNPVFSPDGTQLAYSAELNNQGYVVVNNIQEIIAYQNASYIVFSPNGDEISFVAAKNSSSYVIITATILPINSTPTITNGNESPTYEQIGTTTNENGETVSIIYSSDGNQIAYIVVEGDGVYVVVNGEAGEVYDEITNFIFNDDGSFTYEAINGSETVTIVNNNEVNNSPTPTNTSNPQTTEKPSPTPSSNKKPTPTNNISGNYRYKISTDKDIDRSGDEDVVDYTKCTGEACNF